jgi:hypothetical protein
VAAAEIVVEEQDLEGRIVHQEGAQDVQLVPRAPLVEDPVVGILERPEGVVEVDDHARRQPRQDLEQLEVDV